MGNPLVLQMVCGALSTTVQFNFVGQEGEFNVSSSRTDAGWEFTVHNATSATGRGTARPVLLNQSAHELLFLHFRVFLYGNTPDHTVHYTFFAADKAAVGWQPAPG